MTKKQFKEYLSIQFGMTHLCDETLERIVRKATHIRMAKNGKKVSFMFPFGSTKWKGIVCSLGDGIK